MIRLLLAVTSFLMINVAHAQIYKWIDSQGVVHFSDKPHPGSEQIIIPNVPGYSPPVGQNTGSQQNQEQQSTAQEEQNQYTKIAIIQPLNEATIRNNQGFVLVAVEMEPALADGDNLQLVFDGAPMGEPQPNLVFQLNGIYRGKHTLAVQIINSEGEVLLTSENITIFMHRPRVGMVPGTRRN